MVEECSLAPGTDGQRLRVDEVSWLRERGWPDVCALEESFGCQA